MIIEFMFLLIVVGAGIVFVAWTNTRRRNRDLQERREVADSTGKLKQELERTANEIIGRMENHVTHLESVLDESERNRAQLEGRVLELKKLLKKSEGQSGEIRDLLAKLDDAGSEVDSMQRKMDVVERKLNLAMTAPFPVQQPVTIPPITQPIISQPPVMPIPPAPIPRRTQPPTQVTTSPPAPPLNPLGPITMPTVARQNLPEQKDAAPEKEFDKILEESIAETPKPEVPPQRESIVLSPENKQPMKVVEADPVKIESTRKKLEEASAKMAETPSDESDNVETQAQSLRKKRVKRKQRDVRKAALDAIREAEETGSRDKVTDKPREKVKPEKVQSSERRDLKLETTDSSIIKEMILAGMSIEEISRETGLGRGAIELVQEMIRRQFGKR